MGICLNRRDFLAASVAAGAGLAFASRLEAAPWQTILHKGMVGDPTPKYLDQLAMAGFEGIESTVWDIAPAKAESIQKTAESLNMEIHSVCYGWAKMNQGEAAMAQSVAQVETALQTAKVFGADTVLVVPCRVDVKPMPEPWEFDIRFDEKTGHVKQVVAGDNAKYGKYIEAHNHAIDASREGVRRLIPSAEKAGVAIMLENVWNNLWVHPQIAVNFVDSFDSPWVQFNFDIGNNVKYYPKSQDWIRMLGKRMVKCHAKDFKLNPNGRDGQFCNLREGSVDWPAVRQAIEDVGFSGWMSVEASTQSPAKDSKCLDLIFAGK